MVAYAVPRARVKTLDGMYRIADAVTPIIFQVRIVGDVGVGNGDASKGEWHKPGSDELTACGKPSCWVWMRVESFDENLCTECFTKHERGKRTERPDPEGQ